MIPEENKYICSICKDTEFIFYDKDGYTYAKPCQCKEKKDAIRRMRASGISEEDSKKGFKEFETFNEKPLIDAKNKAVAYFKNFLEISDKRVNSILLSGASGRGKTTLGLAIANNLIASGTAVRYMAYREEVTALKQTITDDIDYKNHINPLKTAKVLFIDDLYKGKITESDINIVYEIINYRYLARLPIIISTEKTTTELIEIDEAIGSRIIEMSKGYIITFDKSTQNYRLR